MLIAAISFIAFPLKAARVKPGTPVTLAIATVPLTTVGLYFMLGSPGVESAEAHTPRAPAPTQQKAASIGTVADMVEGLRAKLEKNADDAGGWLLLARSYDHLGRHADAADAYERARALGKTDVEFETSLMGKISANEGAKSITGPALRGRVDLSPAAAAQVGSHDTVFIFAKESIEHRMPVVALRKPASELPFAFVLTDKEMMVPGQTLEQYESLLVNARISKSGNAMDISHGLEVWSDPVNPGRASGIGPQTFERVSSGSQRE